MGQNDQQIYESHLTREWLLEQASRINHIHILLREVPIQNSRQFQLTEKKFRKKIYLHGLKWPISTC